ncbi:hypothetical protein K435DRAFT_783868 [Dendrothele bispora CBS 962.96]|uniref:Rad51-like C-terminal domain-containing protein n=1 Tax=Dendrothele bispora (strain CBS 962.96) TaxID=1314807 RepID=A0A4S8L6Z3_DENBC|nr:hypothetical protein K435DRAFT_783868 [Dendrothele bispora CBS 962.96]
MSSRPLTSLPLPPSTLSVLRESGYETLDDLQIYDSPDKLTNSLKIPIFASQTLFSATQTQAQATQSRLYTSSTHAPNARTPYVPLTQTLSSLISSKTHSTTRQVFPTGFLPVDELLNGGLRRGHILEISGPPGSLKEVVARGLVKEVIVAGKEERVLWVDCQNGTNPSDLDDLIQGLPNHRRLISYIKIHTLPDLMIFFHNLPEYLDSSPNISLLVINSISFPFLTTPNLNLTKAARSAVLEQIKQVLVKICVTRNVSVVTTCQLSTKLIKPDGSTGNFDTEGVKGMMVPSLGKDYLPMGRTYRILVSLDGGDEGTIRLLSSPTMTTTTRMKGQAQNTKRKFLFQDGTLLSLYNE